VWVYYTLAQVWCSWVDSTWLAQYLLLGGTNSLFRDTRKNNQPDYPIKIDHNEKLKHNNEGEGQKRRAVYRQRSDWFVFLSYPWTERTIQFHLKRNKHIYFVIAVLLKVSNFWFLIRSRWGIVFVLVAIVSVVLSHLKAWEGQGQIKYRNYVQQKFR